MPPTSNLLFGGKVRLMTKNLIGYKNEQLRQIKERKSGAILMQNI